MADCVFLLGNQDDPRGPALARSLVAHDIELRAWDGTSTGIGLYLSGAASIAIDATRLTRVLALTSETEDLPTCCASADDVLVWSGSAPPVAAIAARLKRWLAVESLATSDLVRGNLVGPSRRWQRAVRDVVEAARFSDAPILVSGETGTGKELIARLAHSLDPRPAKKQLVVVDCTNIAPELAGSELFGHERGAFTGAIAARDGAVAMAHDGTLFLDEIGELPLSLQAQLLRVLQEHTYRRVGGNAWQRSEFRLVCATNRDLLLEVEAGRFRRDLYYRIAGVECRTVPLRERREDVLPLVEHFLREFMACEALPCIDGTVRRHLLTRDYPGNVRDLRRLVQTIARRHVGVGPITVGGLPDEERMIALLATATADYSALERGVRLALDAGIGMKDIGRIAEDLALRVALADGESVRAVAERLAVTERTIQIRRAAWRENEPTDAA